MVPALTQMDGSSGEGFNAREEVCAVQIFPTGAPQMVGQVLTKRLDPDEKLLTLSRLYSQVCPTWYKSVLGLLLG